MNDLKQLLTKIWTNIKNSPKEFIKSIPLAPIEITLLVVTIIAIWNLWFIIALVLLYYIAIIKKGNLKTKIKRLKDDIKSLINNKNK